MTEEGLKARQWAFAGNHLRAYVVPLKETYRTDYNGKKINLHYVNIEIEIGNAVHRGREKYKQNSAELADKLDEIYLHYYNRR